MGSARFAAQPTPSPLGLKRPVASPAAIPVQMRRRKQADLRARCWPPASSFYRAW
ncbi:MAG: hypothetical protein QW185_04525 [Thermofilum sp.]